MFYCIALYYFTLFVTLSCYRLLFCDLLFNTLFARYHINLGIDVQECVITSSKVGVKIHISESGASWGSIENSTTLIEGAQKLIEMLYSYRSCGAISGR